MKNAFQMISLLTLIGLLALAVAALYFGAPLFGWVIMAAIFAVFIVEQLSALKAVKQIAAETEVLETCEQRGAHVTGDGVVAKRIALAKELLKKKIRLDSSMAYEVLSNSVSISVPKSSGGTVILLGLMGTFFGLMYSVATAGGAIDNSTTQGTLDTIQLLFQNMKGIFGTSLCGLFAALILNGSRNLMLNARDQFVARLDALTLNLQGEVEADESEETRARNELERLFDSVEKNLSVVAASVKDGLSGVVSTVGDELSSTTAKLNESIASAVAGMNKSVENLGASVSGSLSGAFAPMEQNIKTLSASVESIPSRLDEKLNGISTTLKASLEELSSNVKSSLENVSGSVYDGFYKFSEEIQNGLDGIAGGVKDGLDGVSAATKSSMDSATQNIAESVAEQVRQSNDQWKEFMDRLSAETTANVDSQKEGLETLKNVALQVAEKAQAGSAELSNSVAEKLSALSSDILGAFQKLSETSSVLLEAQKALTESIDNRVVKEKEATDALGGNIVETAELMRVNQSELSANLEMLRAGLETILEKLSGDTAERDEEESFVEHLNQSLEAFHERASEVLLENAVKTQEILLEVLEQTQRNSLQPKTDAKVEG